jgi:hypothetical protein
MRDERVFLLCVASGLGGVVAMGYTTGTLWVDDDTPVAFSDPLDVGVDYDPRLHIGSGPDDGLVAYDTSTGIGYFDEPIRGQPRIVFDEGSKRVCFMGDGGREIACDDMTDREYRREFGEPTPE